MRDYDAAEMHLKRVLELDYKDHDAVRLQLGEVNEERKRYDEALKWYAAVAPGPRYINAQGRYAGVLAKQGKLAEARRHLQEVSPKTPQERVQLIQAEAQLLREAGAYQEAFDLLGGALEKLPDNAELLYDQAMVAEKVNQLEVLEGNLRKLIKQRPDHAHAYNALGYTLADRNVRLTEARTLIETAHKLAPEDPFILDSMGWVMFRLGDLKQAVSYLERAYAQRPDAEIAAHLGEVLWAQGNRARAQKIWSEALKEHPESDILRETMKRFLPEQAVAQ
jgi:tetratricopeptide (TPR) repeat protein